METSSGFFCALTLALFFSDSIDVSYNENDIEVRVSSSRPNCEMELHAAPRSTGTSWVHLLGCVRSDGFIIYHNGSLVKEDVDYEGDNWMIEAERENHVLGAMVYGGNLGFFWEGDIAYYKQYDKALTGEEVKACWEGIDDDTIKLDPNGRGE